MIDKKKLDDLQSQLPEDMIALDGSNFSPAVQRLLLLYSHAPADARYHLDNALQEVLVTGVPRAAMLSALGPGLPRDELGSVREDFEDAMQEAAKIDPKYVLQGSVLEGALRIADEIDKCVKRHLITAQNEKWLNRDSFLDIIQGHATLMRGIAGLTDVPLDYDGEEQSDADDHGADS